MARIACLAPFSAEHVRGLAGDNDIDVHVADGADPAETAAALAEADVVIGDNRQHHRLDRAQLASMRRCRLVQQPAVGHNVIDHRAAAELGIPVANVTSYNREGVADLVVLGLLNLLRQVPVCDREMHAGRWQRRTGRELGSLTVGILGMGNTGTAVLTRLRAFGCRVLYHDIAVRGVSGAEAVPLEELLARSDAVTAHVPLDEDTHHLLGAPELARMPEHALLVNTSRGCVVDEAALAAALRAGRLGGAAIDVFEQEPPGEGSPLRGLDNVLLTPHIGGVTVEARERLQQGVATNVRRVLAGRPPLNVVNHVSTGVLA
ncbi:NAD(P)-dependent oxidoreductase [Salinifilum ghardaiensis]